MKQIDPNPILEIEAMAFAWRDKPVLHAIDLSLSPGRILALLGPNGAGKSTLIRCICGRLKPDSGRVLVAGKNPLKDVAARAATGLVPQQVALYSHLSVTENLAAFARLAGVGRKAVDAAVDRTIEVCDLGEVAGQLAGKLSGGWQRRVNIGCAMSHSPRLLVLDEPTVGVDPPAREDIERLLRRLAEQGLAVLMTSHDLVQLDSLVDSVAFLADGRIAATGAPSDLIHEFLGTAVECTVLLAERPSAQAIEALKAIGLENNGQADRQWSGLVEEQKARHLQSKLPAGIPVIDFRVRRPGLDTLWTQLYGFGPAVTA